MSKFQIKCCCIKCKIETTTGQLTRNHKDKCPSINNVKFPKNIGRTAWNKGLTKETSESLSKASETMKRLGHGGWSKLAATNGGKAGGGYRENAGRSKKFKVTDSFGKETVLQSTYELRCSDILNELAINWIRPKALKYDNRNYFADFYLPDYNIWLDPKNSYKAKQDEEKIRKVIEQNNVKLYILLEEHLTEEFIQRLCS